MTAATGSRTWLPATIQRSGAPVVVHDLYDRTGSAVYHDVAGHDTHEIREVLAAVRSHPGDVLDLAAGSGRLTLPLLAAGRRVTALELSDGMLGILAGRLERAPVSTAARCTRVRADMTDFDVDRTFAVVLLGTTSISLLDEDGRRGLYRCVRRHLAPSGVFLMSTVDVTEAPEPATERSYDITGASGRGYRLHERFARGDHARSVVVVPVDPAVDPPADRPDNLHADIPADIPAGAAVDGTGDGSPADRDDRAIHVFTSRIGVLSADRLAGELVAAGFRIDDRRELPGLAGHHVGTLLTASAVS